MATLYQLDSLTQELLDKAEDGLLDPETLADTMDSLEGEYEEKFDGYGKVIAQLKADAEAAMAESKRLAERAHVLQNNRKQMLLRLQNSMEKRSQRRVKAKLFTFSIRNNPVKLVIDDQDNLPKDFMDHIDKWEPNNPRIKDALKQNIAVSGAHLEQGQSLVVK